MPNRIPLILIVALAAALIAAGCGDDDEEPTTTATTEETATGATGATGAEGASTEFAQQADDICREGNDEIDAEAQERFGDTQQEPSEDEQLSFAEEVVIPSVRSQIDEISTLTPPEGEEDTFDEFISQAQSDLDEIESDPTVLLQRGGGEDPFAETNELARELGLTVCGEG